jgi:soluble lytic murein transglycosylase-like protein
MYKIHAALGVVLALVVTAVVQAYGLLPQPTANVVLAEKSSVILGGQAAVVVPGDLSTSQHQILNKAYAQAKADGHKDPALVQGVLLQETHAGGMNSYKVAGNKGDEYFGLGQLKLAAARDVMASWPALWAKYAFHTRTDDELKANLILNQAFNIEMTSKYLKLLQTRYGLQGRELVNAYNRGPGGVKEVGNDFHYAIGVESKLAEAKRKGKL